MASTVFTYEGTDRSGRKIGGEITSTNANIAKAELRKQGINPSKVTKKRASLNLSILGPKITPGDIALFTRQLATMMKAGVPLVQSFEIVADGVGLTTDYQFTAKTSDLGSLELNASLTVNGAAYTVRSVRKIDDGVLCIVSLTKT